MIVLLLKANKNYATVHKCFHPLLMYFFFFNIETHLGFGLLDNLTNREIIKKNQMSVLHLSARERFLCHSSHTWVVTQSSKAMFCGDVCNHRNEPSIIRHRMWPKGIGFCVNDLFFFFYISFSNLKF